MNITTFFYKNIILIFTLVRRTFFGSDNQNYKTVLQL